MRKNLQKGSKGKDVIELQKILNAVLIHSPKLRIDGDFGEKTEKAVLRFQENAKLKTDGVVGLNTWKALAEMSVHLTAAPLPQFLLADIASKYVGVRETGENRAGASEEMLEIFNADDLMIKGQTDGYPWCAAFVSLCVQKLCHQSIFYSALIPPREASVQNFLYVWAAQNNCLTFEPSDRRTKAIKGDIAVFTFSHIGIVESNTGSLIKTIEGNTNAEGGREGVEVARKSRPYSIIKKIIRLPMTTLGLDRQIDSFVHCC